MSVGVLAVTIPVGDHITRHFLGLTINVDDVLSTVVAGVILIGLGLAVRAKVTSGVPGKLQLAFETIVGGVDRQVESSMGEAGKSIVPLAVTLFLFILIANSLELIPTGHNPQYLPPPTSDVNFPAAMAVFVILLVHATWIRRQGLKNYLAHYFRPFPALFPINVIEELTKPITLTLRLFGNIFSGGLMLVLIADLLPAKLIAPIPILDVVWKIFDGLFVGPVQAFIFALLTILYFESAIAGNH
ncbi:MAG: synthase subcomplex subunit [Acidimicrobiaceae bacterium]|jgi:F-type H+-transporting ATPase subunit a|nr:synthase subcomplex subunit [Acidimicrobiaceae bacterium]